MTGPRMAAEAERERAVAARVAAMRRRYERRCDALREALARAVLELGSARERAEKAEARVRELEAELRERERDPLCISCMADWCQKKGADIGDEDEDFYVANCVTCGRDME